jgi:hypothetical protein
MNYGLCINFIPIYIINFNHKRNDILLMNIYRIMQEYCRRLIHDVYEVTVLDSD